MPLFALVIPFLSLPAAGTTVLIGAMVAGGPEVMILIAAVLLGKEVVHRFKSKVIRTVWDAVMGRPVSKTRYYAGLVIAILSFLPGYLYGYLPDWMPPGDWRIGIMAGSDLSFILSVFLMGGEFWEKLRRLFVWEGTH